MAKKIPKIVREIQKNPPHEIDYSYQKNISYSQISMFKQCQRKWKLQYKDKINQRDASIYLVFGIAVHEVIQDYLTVFYEKSKVKANEIDLEADDYNSGWLNYVIAGAKLTLPIAWLPTFAVTAHNALDEPFRGVKSGKTLSPIKRNIVVGASISPKLGRSTVCHLEVNYKDIGGEFDDVESSRKIAAGLEIEWFRMLYWRLGYGDGFGSAGIGLRAKRFEFDLTTYAVDRSASGFRGEEDRRYALTVSSGF